MNELSGKSPFDRFLFASVSEHDGMVLTVLSALAREDIDPHGEAAHLTQLPRDEATERLAAVIAKTSSECQSPPEAMTKAAELLTLLPTENSSEVRVATAVSNQAQIMMWLAYGIVLGALVFNGGNTQRPATDSHEPSTTTMSGSPLPAIENTKETWNE